MKAGKTYTVSMDLAYAPTYAFLACYARMTIYAGNTPSDTAERLWDTGEFYHTNWARYSFVFTPSRNYKFITFMAAPWKPCDKSIYGSALLIDNLSEALLETPQLTVTAKNTCKGENKGEATVTVKGVTQPYTVKWSPGGQTTEHVTGLAPGSYEVTVKLPSGASTTKQVTVVGWEVKNKVTVIPSACYGQNNNTIEMTTDGGTAPYRYYFNGSKNAVYTPTFSKLTPGSYNVLVKDEEGCTAYIDNIAVAEPAPLEVTAVRTKDVSCTSTMDGKIRLEVAGGTPPYAFSLDYLPWQSNNNWGGLDAGSFHFRVKDAHECATEGSTVINRNIRECAVFVPTAFTPNNDGQNDLFRAKVHDDVREYRLEVYSRWGQTVFRTDDPEGAWNGEFRGSPQPGGAYVWVLTYTDSKQQARKQTGTVMLIR